MKWYLIDKLKENSMNLNHNGADTERSKAEKTANLEKCIEEVCNIKD